MEQQETTEYESGSGIGWGATLGFVGVALAITVGIAFGFAA
jgi:hypothetical protein